MKKTKIIVLGAGRMGTYIASSLASDFQVTLASHNKIGQEKIQNKNISKIKADLSDGVKLKSIVADFDFVVSALPESFGYDALENVLESGKNAVDISFWKQTGNRLSKIDNIARKKNLTALIDSGIAPGLSNAIAAYFDLKLGKKTKNINIYVGGISHKRERGFFASWSVSGLIEEYERQALRVTGGKLEKIQALSQMEKINFPNVGLLDAAITDGLRSLPLNLRHIKNMSEYTLRYPGHFQQMKNLRSFGYFQNSKISAGQKTTAFEMSQRLMEKAGDKSKTYKPMLEELGFFDTKRQYECIGGKISPREIASDVLSETWKMKPEDKDVLVMRIQADDTETQYTADIFAKHDNINSAMAVTTGGMAVLATKMMIGGNFPKKGVFPLELLIENKPELIDFFIEGLKKLGVEYSESKSGLNL